LKQLNLDSLEFLEIIYELEEEFDCALDSSQLNEMKTIADLIAAFSTQQKQCA